MTEQLVVGPLLVALVTAIATLLARPSDKLQRGVSLLGSLAYLGVVALLFSRVVLPLGSEPRTLVYQVSNWRAPFGIVLVADALSAFMLGLAAVVSLAALVFSILYVDSYGQRLSYHPLYHFMLVGVSGSFLTGDIFNLFVWFEVMLMASYILVLFYSQAEHTRAALYYVVLNLVGSAVMLLAIGGIYAATGTLNMADLARRLAEPAAYGVDVLPVLGLAAVFFSVFALKAGLFPFQFWVPAAYRAAPVPVTAVLAGVVKKVGVYAVIRLYFTVFSAATLEAGLGLPGLSGESFLAFFGPVMFLMAVASILFGGLSAVGQEDIDGVLAYSSIGQVGFIVLPLAVGATVPAVREVAVAAALVYSFNHGLAKGLLFLASGTVYSALGTIRFRDLGGLAPRAPVLAGSFLVGALALIGVPPLLGFFGKFLVFRTAADALAAGGAGAALALAVALAGAVLTIAYFTRAWNLVFWGEPTERVEAAIPRRWVGTGGAAEAAGTVADGSGGSAGAGPPGRTGDAVEDTPDAAGGPEEGDTDTPGAADAPDAADPSSARDDPLAETPIVEAPAGADRLTGSGELRDLTLAGEVVVVASLAVAVVGFGVGFEGLMAAAEAAARAALDTGTYVDAVAPADVTGDEAEATLSTVREVVRR